LAPDSVEEPEDLFENYSPAAASSCILFRAAFKRSEMFGGILRALRLSSGMTQQQLADAAGISTAYVSALESGRKPAPPRAVVMTLATALNVQEQKLWATARDERESRLVARIDGQPSSSRSGQSEDSGNAKDEADETQSPASQFEPLLVELFLAIRAAAIRTDRPIHLINSLRLLVEQIGLTEREEDG
jgi:transcriptional regulator with XRE-family HTH domain